MRIPKITQPDRTRWFSFNSWTDGVTPYQMESWNLEEQFGVSFVVHLHPRETAGFYLLQGTRKNNWMKRGESSVCHIQPCDGVPMLKVEELSSWKWK